MLTAVLDLDDALTRQPRLRQAVTSVGGKLVYCRDLGPPLRLWARPPALQHLRERLEKGLPPRLGPAIVFSGSGDFHHITPILLERAMAASGETAVTVLHFDNHPDWVRFAPGAHCGSWVGSAARLPGVARVITIGVCSADLDDATQADLQPLLDGRVEIYPYRKDLAASARWTCNPGSHSIEAMGEADFTDFLPGRIETGAVYVTIDKDLLRPEDAGTNWDQGRTSLALLEALIGRALKGRRLIGADITGDWSRPVYGGGLAARALKWGEALLDQPWRAPSAGQRRQNETVNLALFDHLQAVAQ